MAPLEERWCVIPKVQGMIPEYFFIHLELHMLIIELVKEEISSV